jgi:biopolymer transport protein ExbD
MITTNLRPRRHRSPELNITPLIDVVFLLLIFFMVSTTFDRFSEIRIELPEANAERQEREPVSIDITIDRAGRYYVNQRQVVDTTLGTLRQALEKALDGRSGMPVVISADGQAPHQSVITAMDASSRVGLSRITFATAGTAEQWQ